MKWEEIWERQPLRDSWWACPGGFLIDNLGSLQKRKDGRETSLGKGAAYFRARLAFGPFKCSQLALLARTVFGT